MAELAEGQIVEGVVDGIKDFGAFVKIKETGKTGLVHISEVADAYVNDIEKEGYLEKGQNIRVKIKNIRSDGKIDLSFKEVKKERRYIKKKSKAKYIPEDTRLALDDDKVYNLNLKANFYLNKFDRDHFDRGEIFKSIKSCARRIKTNDLQEALLNRQNRQSKALDKSGHSVNDFVMKNDYRLVVGLGDAHVLETNMTLHHIYGLPYIPGSSLKGLAKTYAVEKLRRLDMPKKENREYEKVEDALEGGNIEGLNFTEEAKSKLKSYKLIFGTQEEAGKVNFMDAYPLGDINIEIDIMTPHFQGYYGEMAPEDDSAANSWPVDFTDPVPIPFLVLEDPKFQFNVVGYNGDLVETASELLKGSLKELGIGAKTMVGYGYFK